MRILAADDDEFHLSLLALMLRENKYGDVTLASSATEALGRIRDATVPFDCFLLDIEMPGLNGIDLCRDIRRIPAYAGVPILMLTRLSDRDHMEAAFAAGATDFITKPIDKLEFSTRLRLASEMLQQKQRIEAMGAEVEAINREHAPRPAADLATPFALDDVLGAIEYLAFENYLFRISVEARNLDVFAVKIGNVDEIFNAATATDFRFVVNCVGDAIAEALKRRRFFLTYAGNGVFPVALRDGLGLELESFAVDLFSLAPDIEVSLAPGQQVQPALFIGAPVKLTFFPRKANLRALSIAIANANAEEAASEGAKEDPARPEGGPKKRASLFGILKAS